MCIKFCFRLVKTAAETEETLKLASREETMSITQSFQWFSEFKSGVTSANSAECSGCLFMSSLDENRRETRILFKKIDAPLLMNRNC
jgi:hypothetical protein